MESGIMMNGFSSYQIGLVRFEIDYYRDVLQVVAIGLDWLLLWSVVVWW